VKDVELTDNILWLLKQAFHFSLTTVNEAIGGHGVTTAQIGLMRQLANEPGLSGAELARRLLISPQGVQLALAARPTKGCLACFRAMSSSSFGICWAASSKRAPVMRFSPTAPTPERAR